jgi:hypothetical protein
MVTTRPIDTQSYFDESTKSILGVPELLRRGAMAGGQQTGQNVAASLGHQLRSAAAANTARHSLAGTMAGHGVMPDMGMLDPSQRAALEQRFMDDRIKRGMDIAKVGASQGLYLPPDQATNPLNYLNRDLPYIRGHATSVLAGLAGRNIPTRTDQETVMTPSGPRKQTIKTPESMPQPYIPISRKPGENRQLTPSIAEPQANQANQVGQNRVQQLHDADPEGQAKLKEKWQPILSRDVPGAEILAVDTESGIVIFILNGRIDTVRMSSSQ